MLGLLALDQPPSTPGTGGTGPEPPGTERVQHLIEWIGIAIFAALVIGAIVILIRSRRG